MGKSNSIEQQQKSNQAFQEYVNSMNNEMNKHLAEAKSAIDALITNHYKPYPDKAELIVGEYSHLATVSEWSLGSVNKILDACRNAIFGAQAPDGTQKGTDDKKVDASIAELKSRELLIANAAFDVVQSTLSTIGSSSSTSITTKTDAKAIAPGMMLFICVMENSYNRKDFFAGETIVQNMFVFRVYYSIKEGESVSKLNDLQAYENQKAAFRSLLKQNDEKVASLDVTSDNFMTDLQKLTAISETLNKRLVAINEKIAQLSSSNMLRAGRSDALVHDTEGDAIVQRITSKRDAALASYRRSL
ncbi:hypothetical protein [Saezia sanguinis]|uniref:hypothetical protein n=1 Tax=Saezia sanguinis TaxID=1965230 RepID=UPI00301F8A3C